MEARVSEAPQSRLRKSIAKFGARIQATPYLLVAAVALALTMIKGGLAGVGPNFLGPLREAAAALPLATNSYSASIGHVLIMRALGSPPSAVWWFLGGVVWLATLWWLMIRLRAAGSWARLGALVIAGSPLTYSLGAMLGHYDLWLVAGSLVLVLARHRPVAGAGVLVACLGNPQQAVVAAIAMLCTSALLPHRPAIRRAVVFVGAAVGSWVLAEWWLSFSEVASRTSLLDRDGLLFAARLFSGAWPLTLYSLLGPVWLVLILLLVGAPKRYSIAALPALTLPLGAMLITLDMTRVFVATATAAVTVLLVALWRVWRDTAGPSDVVVGSWALVAVVLPVFMILPEPSGFVRLPYDELLTFLGWAPDWSLSR